MKRGYRAKRVILTSYSGRKAELEVVDTKTIQTRSKKVMEELILDQFSGICPQDPYVKCELKVEYVN